MSTLTDNTTDDKVDEYVGEPGDDEKFSHYAPKDAITDAMVFGTPVTALCGKQWTPTRDPSKFPVCPECKDIYETLRDE